MPPFARHDSCMTFLFPVCVELLICLNCMRYAQSVLCVTGGNSVSSSRRNGPPPFGGLSVAAIISWYFSDSTNPFTFRLSSFHLHHVIWSGYNDKDVYRRCFQWYMIYFMHSDTLPAFFFSQYKFLVSFFWAFVISEIKTQALYEFECVTGISLYLSASSKYFIDHCLRHIAVRYIHKWIR